MNGICLSFSLYIRNTHHFPQLELLFPINYHTIISIYLSVISPFVEVTMGNVCSPSFSCDQTISRCLDCTVRKARYITTLQDNVVDLQRELQKITEERNDVRTKVNVAEQQRQMKRLERVQGWLSRVEDVETEARRLLDQSQQEVEQLCLGGFCSKNCKSSYKFGKQVANTLQDLKNLRAEGDFEVVAQTAPEDAVDERSIPSTVVGLESTLEKVWRCITEEQTGIIGIYGMGGVGKTTLLTQINNKFLQLLDKPNRLDFVIWAVVSKDLELEKIKESIAKKIGLFDQSWESKSLSEKAQEIFKLLSRKKFALLLDDIWQEVSFSELGLPNPSKNGSKVIFTTRTLEVCGKMVAEKTFQVEYLIYEDAWTLFEKNVQKVTLDSDPTIPGLAKTVVNECAGLPLALIVVGRAMAFKKTPQEWEYAIQVLQHSAFEFSDIEEKVFHPLKLSYNFLPNEKTRFCLLYCTLFPEDYKIKKEELIDCWICEEFLDGHGVIGSRNEGYDIIGTLLRACLLEEVEGGNCVKMHDVIRDMALWISSTTEKEKEKFLVLAGRGLNQAPRIPMWEDITRMSLMKNKIKNLSESPTCPPLRTLFLGENGLQMIESDFFQSMSSLHVLNLSRNNELQHLSPGISYLVSLQYLNLSWTKIQKLPEELKSLVNLKCLNLEWTHFIRTISRQLISDLKMLRIMRMFLCGYAIEQEEDSVLFGGGECLIEELLCLEHLNVLTIHLQSSGAVQRVFSSPILSSIIRSLSLQYLNDLKSLSVISLASLRYIEILRLYDCVDLEEFKIDYPGELKIIQQSHGFHSLQEVFIRSCMKLRHMTFLIFAPNLKSLWIGKCKNMEEIIKLDEIPTELLENLIPFPRLRLLQLYQLLNLKSISSSAFQFSQLQNMIVRECPNLHKLPLDCSSGSEGNKFIIHGDESWWNNLQWDNEATKNAFLPYFKAIVL